ncbi:hypothetical protein [Streptomyces sp. NPDC013489]|uniref:hypothetical protein n=1 Tax=Streptomyces sp. NPDC013489 TaxID=3155606 RepID=UPI003410050A
MGPDTAIDDLQQQIVRLEQRAVDFASALEDREAELDAARAANRELTRALNQRE